MAEMGASAGQLALAAAVAVAAAGRGRSNNPQPGDRPLTLERAVEAAAEALASASPTPGPAASPLLNGAWALLYSGRSRRLAAAAAFPASSAAAPSLREALQAASDAAYSAFYKYVPVLAGSAVGRARGSSATNFQVLRPGRVDNVVTTKGPLPLRLCVSGSIEVVQPPGGVAPSCVAVRFDAFTARLGGLPEAALSLGWLRPLGYVDTLYLDQEMRVSVGDKGGLFVLRRVAADGAEASAASAAQAATPAAAADQRR
ncbi:hypothetical protein ABPG75_005044 [Micractinium tetrahymenae]